MKSLPASLQFSLETIFQTDAKISNSLEGIASLGRHRSVYLDETLREDSPQWRNFSFVFSAAVDLTLSHVPIFRFTFGIGD